MINVGKHEDSKHDFNLLLFILVNSLLQDIMQFPSKKFPPTYKKDASWWTPLLALEQFIESPFQAM
jgi:hypothetical protein